MQEIENRVPFEQDDPTAYIESDRINVISIQVLVGIREKTDRELLKRGRVDDHQPVRIIPHVDIL